MACRSQSSQLLPSRLTHCISIGQFSFAKHCFDVEAARVYRLDRVVQPTGVAAIWNMLLMSAPFGMRLARPARAASWCSVDMPRPCRADRPAVVDVSFLCVRRVTPFSSHHGLVTTFVSHVVNEEGLDPCLSA